MDFSDSVHHQNLGFSTVTYSFQTYPDTKSGTDKFGEFIQANVSVSCLDAIFCFHVMSCHLAVVVSQWLAAQISQ